MSDLSTVAAISASSPQLPVHWYFDPGIYEIEKRLLFDHGPGYVGHELMVPNIGDYQTLQWLGDAKALVRNSNGIELLSNVCRHRQAIILKGRGSAKSIVCPVHRWTYGLDGKLLGAPHFPGNPCLDLARTPLANWNGLLFAGRRDIARDLEALSVAKDLDFSGFMFDHVEIDEYQCNWKTFIEVYLEDYHVEPFHPGLGNFVNVADLEWEFGDWYSVQSCGVKLGLAKPGSQVYRRWHEQVLRYDEGRTPAYGAIWLTYFPNIMVEWYPHSLVVSTIVPRGPEACTNVVEFYYPEDIALFEREFVEAEQAAYRETAIEDTEICERMTAGRRALLQQGLNESGPYQSPMEDGMLHFHEFLRHHVESHVAQEA
ncbi:MAG: aromatic ring-hydroxylating dioxygenase subunit alpha [Betaproteobacteria bacterium]|nr:aromatic ring-hydroxylating dioxygenase subunit alpha [Betaproteobacteria bacterium]